VIIFLSFLFLSDLMGVCWYDIPYVRSSLIFPSRVFRAPYIYRTLSFLVPQLSFPT
jgi:hypothetical protein